MCVHQRGTKKYMEINLMDISKKFLYYKYCITTGTEKKLSFFWYWGGWEKWLKIAIFGEKTVTFSKYFRIESIIFEWVIIAKKFSSYGWTFRKKRFLIFCAPIRHIFNPQIWGVDFKKIKIWAKSTIGVFVPVVCMLNKNFVKQLW